MKFYQSCHLSDVGATFATKCLQEPTFERASAVWVTGPHFAGKEPLFAACQRLRDFAGGIYEKLHDGAERAVLQGDDPDRPAGHR